MFPESANLDFTVSIVDLRRLVFSLILGFAVALLPSVTANLPESGIYSAIGLVIRLLLLPGVLVCMAAVRNVHAIDIHTVYAIDVIFYIVVFYLLFGAWAKRKASSRTTDDR